MWGTESGWQRDEGERKLWIEGVRWGDRARPEMRRTHRRMWARTWRVHQGMAKKGR